MGNHNSFIMEKLINFQTWTRLISIVKSFRADVPILYVY